MDAREWLRQAEDELAELAQLTEFGQGDAWRALVLVARLLQSSFGLMPPTALMSRLTELFGVCGSLPPEGLLDRLAEALADTSDPAGLLHDSLLDVDDTAGVLQLYGTSPAELINRANAMIALWPERVEELSAFAELRLDTLRKATAVAPLWHAVLRAPAHAWVAALPSARLTPTVAGRWQAQVSDIRALPPQVLQMAASSQTRDEFGLGDGVFLEQHGRHWRVEARDATSLRIELRRRTDSAVLVSEDVQIEVEGRTGYADLGPVAGPKSLLHRLLASTGLPAESVDAVIVVGRVDG